MVDSSHRKTRPPLDAWLTVVLPLLVTVDKPQNKQIVRSPDTLFFQREKDKDTPPNARAREDGTEPLNQ